MMGASPLAVLDHPVSDRHLATCSGAAATTRANGTSPPRWARTRPTGLRHERRAVGVEQVGEHVVELGVLRELREDM